MRKRKVMTKFSSSQNRQFWEKDALDKKDNPIGTHSDPYLVELENEFIISTLKHLKPKSMLDIGCGNGQRTINFSQFVSKSTRGIDYSSKMIEQANLLLSKKSSKIKKNIEFKVQDVQQLQKDNVKFDVVVSCRCFINQTSYSNQIKLFKLIHSILKKNGSLIIAEGSHEGYQYLNSMRKKFNLKLIKIPWYNLPIKEKVVIPKLNRFFKISKTSRLGTYYYLTRVLHPSLVFPKNPNPRHKINKLSLQSEYLFRKEGFINDSLDRCGAHLLIQFKKI